MGIELLNEPSAATVPLDILVSYYTRGYQIVRNHSTTAYVILCQRIGNADPIELFQAGIGLSNVVVDLHYYNLFDPYFASMNSTQNIEFIYKNRAPQLQALRDTNGPLLFIGMIATFLHCFHIAVSILQILKRLRICSVFVPSFPYCWSWEFGVLRIKTQFSVYFIPSILDYLHSHFAVSLFVCSFIVQVNGLMNGTCKMHLNMSTRSLAELSWMFMRTPPLGGHIGH